MKSYFGNKGLLVLAFIIGVTDIDPFILSIIHGNQVITPVLVSAIIISMMGNTLIKGIYFGTLAKEARKETFWKFGLLALLHLPFILL